MTGRQAIESLADAAEDCDDPNCPNCASIPLPHDLPGVITRVSFEVAQEAASDVESDVRELCALADLSASPEGLEVTRRHAVYATAAKLLLDEAKEQAQEDPDGVWGSLHYTFALLSDHLSKIFGRRVTIQITERDESGA
jgi:hypothetical protein